MFSIKYFTFFTKKIKSNPHFLKSTHKNESPGDVGSKNDAIKFGWKKIEIIKIWSV